MEDIKKIDSKYLFKKKEKVIIIMHEGTQYILRITKENKLILTK
jgi:hemin uptake protein HemP